MTTFETLLLHLRALLADPSSQARRAAADWLEQFRAASPTSRPSPPLEHIEQLGQAEVSAYSLQFASELLSAILDGDRQETQARAAELLNFPLAANPFDGQLLLIAAQAVAQGGGDPAGLSARHRAYGTRFGGARAISGLGGLLSDQQLAGMLEEQRRDESWDGAEGALGTQAPQPLELPRGEPLSSSSAEPPPVSRPRPRYPVAVRQLIDARTARFKLSRATLLALDSRSTQVAEILLEAEPETPRLEAFGTLHGLRLVFSSAQAAETFDRDDGSLLAVQPLSDTQLYFKLRLSEPWLRAHLPNHALWSQLECCVLLSRD